MKVRCWPRGFRAAVGFAVVAGVLLVPSGAFAGAEEVRVAVSGVTVAAGDSAGDLSVVWDAPSPAPAEYRVRWAPEGESFRIRSDSDWNAFPSEPSLVVSGLTPGGSYSVQVRARFGPGDNSPWSDTATGTAAAEAAPAPTIEAADAPPLLAQAQLAAPVFPPATMEDCRHFMADGSPQGDVLECAVNSFGVAAYTERGEVWFDWSAWEADQAAAVVRYSIQQVDMTQRSNFRDAHTKESVPPWTEGQGQMRAVPGANSCLPRSKDNGATWAWQCTSPVRDSGPVSLLNADDGATFLVNRAPSGEGDTQMTLMTVPSRDPSGHNDRLTAAEVADTVETIAFEMTIRLLRVTAHFDDASTHSGYTVVTAGHRNVPKTSVSENHSDVNHSAYDFSDSTRTAGYLQADGDPATGSIGSASDGDWLRLELEAGNSYRIDVKGAAAADYGGTQPDPLFRVRDHNGDVLADTAMLDPTSGHDLANSIGSDDGGVDNNASLTLTVITPGTYYIDIISRTDQTGTYTTTLTTL